jgi:hypothetical protein
MNMTSKELLDTNNPNNVARLHQHLFDDSDDEDERAAGITHRAPILDVADGDCDTDASECIEEREDSGTEQSDMDVSSGEEDDVYHCYRKKGKKITESFDWGGKKPLHQPQEN